LALLALFILISIFFAFYDYQYFDNLDRLDFLKKEIVKVHFPYGQLKFGLNDENIYKLIPTESKLKKSKNRLIRRMFKEYNMDDIKEKKENEESEEDDFDANIYKNEKITEKVQIKNNLSKSNSNTRREL
jgi:hypothetical protein